MPDSVTQTAPPAPSQAAAKPRRRRWPKLVAGLLVLLLVVVWFAPAIIAKTAARGRLARSASEHLNGTLDIGGASLGWFSPIELRDITLTDSRGRVIARIPKITSGRTLLGLVWNSSEPGEFVLDRPEVEIVCEKQATNLEDMLRKILEDTTPPGPTRTPLIVRIYSGTLALKDSEKGWAGEFRDLDATVTVPASRSEAITAKVSANAPGRVDAEIVVGETSRVKLAASGFALETLAPLLRRFEPELTLTGSLTTDVTATWGKGAADIDGTFRATNLAVATPGMNGDTLKLASAELPLKVAIAGRSVRVEHADFTSDVGSASLAGTFDPDEPLDKLLDRPGAKLDATVDVAKLAAALPRLLRIRDGTEFREGKLVVKVESKAEEKGTSWTGSVNTSALKAIRGGKEIHWDEPLSVEFAGRVKPGQLPTFDKLICKSEFVAINAEIKPDLVRAAANIYLDKLAARLAEFVDLEGVTLDGRGSAWVIAQRTPAGEFKADGGGELKQFAVADRSGKGIREPELKLTFSANGSAPDAKPVSIASATLGITAGADELHLRLLEALPDAKQLAGGKFDAKLTGDLARWRKRLAGSSTTANAYPIAGRVAASVRFQHAGSLTSFAGSIDVTNFVLGTTTDPDWAEPTLRLELDGSYTESTDTLALTAAKLERPGLQLAVAGTITKFDTTTEASLTGSTTYDMAKLTPKLRELLGGNFAAEGKGSKPVALAGSLTPPRKPGAKEPPNVFGSLTAELGFGWNSLHAYGFEMGAGELRTKLADGTARVTPVVATFGGGKVTLAPTIHLDPAPGEVTFAKGMLVEKAKLTPAACAGAVGYALPVIANAGQAEGEISVLLDENHIPLGNPRKAKVKGTVTIHKATVSAGPVVTEIAKLLGADGATMTLANEQAVPVRVENGRVYHENLGLKIGAYTINTTGSVGFDSTLDLVADVPIPGGLPGFKNTPALAKVLSGKRVQVPVKGTLAAPMLDARAFQFAVAKLAQDAAKDVGKDLLHKELDKLFPGMPKK